MHARFYIKYELLFESMTELMKNNDGNHIMKIHISLYSITISHYTRPTQFQSVLVHVTTVICIHIYKEICIDNRRPSVSLIPKEKGRTKA